MTESSQWAGQVALVTGGGSGVGADVCHRLAGLGVAVGVVDRSEEGAASVARAIIAAGGRALAVTADVTDPQAVDGAVGRIASRFGGLHLAVNNAGIPTSKARAEDVTLDEWNRVLGVNLTGTFLCLRAELPAIRESGGGAIVNLASILGLNGMAGRAAYAAAKHGVVGLTKSAALDYARQGIRINAVAPGYVETPLLQGRSEEEKRHLAAMHPLQRLAQAGEISALILFLLSAQASFITGQTYLADGGYSAQ